MAADWEAAAREYVAQPRQGAQPEGAAPGGGRKRRIKPTLVVSFGLAVQPRERSDAGTLRSHGDGCGRVSECGEEACEMRLDARIADRVILLAACIVRSHRESARPGDFPPWLRGACAAWHGVFAALLDAPSRRVALAVLRAAPVLALTVPVGAAREPEDPFAGEAGGPPPVAYHDRRDSRPGAAAPNTLEASLYANRQRVRDYLLDWLRRHGAPPAAAGDRTAAAMAATSVLVHAQDGNVEWLARVVLAEHDQAARLGPANGSASSRMARLEARLTANSSAAGVGSSNVLASGIDAGGVAAFVRLADSHRLACALRPLLLERIAHARTSWADAEAGVRAARLLGLLCASGSDVFAQDIVSLVDGVLADAQASVSGSCEDRPIAGLGASAASFVALALLHALLGSVQAERSAAAGGRVSVPKSWLCRLHAMRTALGGMFVSGDVCLVLCAIVMHAIFEAALEGDALQRCCGSSACTGKEVPLVAIRPNAERHTAPLDSSALSACARMVDMLNLPAAVRLAEAIVSEDALRSPQPSPASSPEGAPAPAAPGASPAPSRRKVRPTTLPDTSAAVQRRLRAWFWWQHPALRPLVEALVRYVREEGLGRAPLEVVRVLVGARGEPPGPLRALAPPSLAADPRMLVLALCLVLEDASHSL